MKISDWEPVAHPVPDLLDEEDCFISNVGSSVDNSLCLSKRDNLSYVDVYW